MYEANPPCHTQVYVSFYCLCMQLLPFLRAILISIIITFWRVLHFRFVATNILYTQRCVVCNRFIIYTTLCKMQLISYIHNVGRWWHLTHRNLVLTNQTKLILTVALTLTDTVTVIFFTRISSRPIKRLYRNNKRNFCGGAVAGFVGGPVFPFSDFLPVCWQEFDSKFILYR